MADSEALTHGPLAGLRVLDLANTFAGALAGQLLADFGAEVVHVEPPGGSVLRSHPAYPFWARGKRSIELDLRVDADAEVARGLARDADVIVETWRPGVAERFGLGYDELAAANERLVYASITGFGRTGPFSHLKGYEGLVAAKVGLPTVFSRMVARPGPAFVSVPFCSWGAAQTALQGVLAALHERERSGRGQRVDASLVQGFASYDTWNWFIVLLTQRHPGAFTPAPPFDARGIPATGFYFRLPVLLSADGHWMQFSQTSPRLFRAFLRALGLDWMFDDPKWSEVPEFEDADKRAAMWELMIEAARQKTFAEWQQVFDDDPDVWGESFRRGPELLDHPQMQYDHQVLLLDDAQRGKVRQPAAMVRMNGTPADVERSAPAVDEDGGALRANGWTSTAGPRAETHDGERPPTNAPLDGVTVLELGGYYAAPFGATLLADLGARVIKIEPLDGDPLRTILPFPEIGAVKALQGKESVALDMTTDEGRAVVHELARRSDIVLRAYRAEVAERHGIDAATLRSINPDLVYLDAPGYGLGGPCGRRPAFAPTIAAGSGLAMRNVGPSVPERADLTMDEIKHHSTRLSASAAVVSAQSDGMAALGVGTALALGLVARDRGAGGQSMLTTMLSTAAHALSELNVQYEGMDDPPTSDPELYGINARYRLYEASDGWVFLAAPALSEWDALADALAPYVTLRDDARFADPATLDLNDAALADVLAGVFRTRPAADWERELTAADVGCAVVDERPCELIMMSDDFGGALDLVVEVEHPVLDRHPRLAPLVRLSRSRTTAGPGPALGAHTEAVLHELGYTGDDVAGLRERGVIL